MSSQARMRIDSRNQTTTGSPRTAAAGFAGSQPGDPVARPAGGSPAQTRPAATPQVCALVPTRNEAANVAPLVERLRRVLAAWDAEVLFVDDSSDRTPAQVLAVADHVRGLQDRGGSPAGFRVRLLHRAAGERTGGLGGAVQAGLAATGGRHVVVMDGDLQHPPEVVAQLLGALDDGADVVVASRYCATGSAAGLSSWFRAQVSSGATSAARLVFPRTLRGVSDPMSGFFALRAGAVQPAALHPRGFKILLEILARTPGLRVVEVPFEFGSRQAEDSKASWREAVRYARQLAALRAAAWRTQAGSRRPFDRRRWATATALVGRHWQRLVRFGAVGASGTAVNLGTLFVLAGLLRMPHLPSAGVATEAAVLNNFWWNDRWTFRCARPRLPLPRRLGSYHLVALAGALVALGLFTVLETVFGWDYLLAETAGILAGLGFNYLASCRFTWRHAPAGSPSQYAGRQR